MSLCPIHPYCMSLYPIHPYVCHTSLHTHARRYSLLLLYIPIHPYTHSSAIHPHVCHMSLDAHARHTLKRMPYVPRRACTPKLHTLIRMPYVPIRACTQVLFVAHFSCSYPCRAPHGVRTTGPCPCVRVWVRAYMCACVRACVCVSECVCARSLSPECPEFLLRKECQQQTTCKRLTRDIHACVDDVTCVYDDVTCVARDIHALHKRYTRPVPGTGGRNAWMCWCSLTIECVLLL